MTADTAILRAFRAAGERAISGTELAEQLGISRAAIWARIEELRSLGYEIQASPHDGYRLRGMPDVLHGDDMLAQVPDGQIIGRDIRVFQQTTSTNDVVDKLGRDGVKEGVVVFAETQTRGRGRLGRTWVSNEAKGLWFSVLLRPPLPPQSATQLTIASATSLVRALDRASGLRCEIKWPNDILAGGRKICGILTEMSAELDTVKHVVLGIGLNVNFDTRDFPPDLRKIATSIKIESGREFRRCDVAAAILKELNDDYQRILRGKFEEIAEEWESNCSTIGHNVEIACGPRVFLGRAESLDAEGALLVRTQHGRLERVVGGDVTLKK